MGVEPTGRDAVTELDARLGQRLLAEHPLERRAPARECDEVVVAGTL